MTDANLLLGYLAADAPLAGDVRLDRDAAERAIAGLAGQLGLDHLDCAEGIRRVAGAEMVRALRVVTVERGIDPRAYALLAFGGAGPLHAVQIAEELGIETILCPRASGVLAALGLVVSDRRRDAQRSVLWSGDQITEDAIARAVERLGLEARQALGEPCDELRVTYELRYLGQSFELAVTAGTDASPAELREAFEAEHADRYGYSDPEQTLELVTVRVTATATGADVTLAQSAGELERGRRDARIRSRDVEIEVLRGVPPPGTSAHGPAVFELPEATVLVEPGWRAEVDETGTIQLTRGE